jgi:hypothetical protein
VNVASLEAPTTATIALPGPSGLQKCTISMEKPKARTPGPYKALNAALDKAQEDGVMPTIQMVKTLEECITKQYEKGPWLKGDYTLGEEFNEDEDVNMSVVLPVKLLRALRAQLEQEVVVAKSECCVRHSQLRLW